MTLPSPSPRIVGRPTLVLGLLVFCGAAVGTLARASLSDAFPHDEGSWPWATFWINLSGSFVLGALLEFLALAGPDDGRRRKVRLGIGTGVLGGFTTYSTFVIDLDTMTRDGYLPLGVGYAAVSVVVGIALAAAGMGLVGMFAGSEPLVEDGDAA